MKKRIFLAVALACSALSAWAQTYTVTPSATSYSSAGGNLTFTVSLAYPATVSTVSFGAKPPAASWKYVSVGGTNVPGLAPVANDTTDPADSGSIFGFTYLSDPNTGLLPTSPVSFTFVLNYPAGLTGNQVITFRGDYRNAGVLTPVTVASVTLTSTPEPASIITQPASVSVKAGQNATFTVVAGGSPTPTLQWQRSTDAGATWNNVTAAPYSGVTTSTLTVTAVTLAMTNDRFRVVATNTSGSVNSDGAATLTVTQAPVIIQQPTDQPVLVGTTATFGVTATGTGTLTYQWYFTPKSTSTPQLLSGSTAASLTIASAQAANEGDYVVVVSNGVIPDATSSAAKLTIVPRVVRIVSQSVAAGGTAVVPVQLVATGAENALGFSIVFDPTQLTYVSVAAGAQATDATLNSNVSQIATGKIGIALAKATGQTWAAGTQEVLKVTFTLNASLAGGTVAPVIFGSSPVLREISDATANTLTAGYQDGNVTVSSGFEADMNGNGVVSITDWVKVGRIVAGLDTVANGIDFQKADCAGRATLGNGVLSISDWVQAGRYAAGLDPLTPAGGPTAPNP